MIHLASRSPRRRELLAQIGVRFSVLPFRAAPREDREVDETPLAGELPEDYVLRVARAKAAHGAVLAERRGLAAHPVLAADTTLELDGRIIGKPEDAEDARQILESLSGRTHRVLTAVALCRAGVAASELSISEVSFRILSVAEIAAYIASGEPFDKAGAYGIQGRAAVFVSHLSGSYTGVMGLPLFETARLLEDAGYSWR
ncbi:MAG: Maf family nucleotide pyrophosphatase [Betaproteobacteria bacterium]|nr:Maf family nucleotide pyrophosphatase [Betaproteobacteria bacterium]